MAADPLQRMVEVFRLEGDGYRLLATRAGTALILATTVVACKREAPNKHSIGEVKVDAKSTQRPDGGPIPIGNGQLLRGL